MVINILVALYAYTMPARDQRHTWAQLLVTAWFKLEHSKQYNVTESYIVYTHSAQ
jgi:hypothetical protein